MDDALLINAIEGWRQFPNNQLCFSLADYSLLGVPFLHEGEERTPVGIVLDDHSPIWISLYELDKGHTVRFLCKLEELNLPYEIFSAPIWIFVAQVRFEYYLSCKQFLDLCCLDVSQVHDVDISRASIADFFSELVEATLVL